MKRIAIFCDGTWNRSDAKFPTNVVRLSLVGRAHRRRRHRAGSRSTWPGSAAAAVDRLWPRPVDRWGGGPVRLGPDREPRGGVPPHRARSTSRATSSTSSASRAGRSPRARSAACCAAAASPPAATSAASRRRSRGTARATAPTHPDHEDSFMFRRGFSAWLHTSEKEAGVAARRRGAPAATSWSSTYLGRLGHGRRARRAQGPALRAALQLQSTSSTTWRCRGRCCRRGTPSPSTSGA